MSARRLWLIVGLATACSPLACSVECLAASCWDTLLVSVQLPSEPATYTFRIATDQGETSCDIAVPVRSDRGCEDGFVSFWRKEGADETVAEIAIQDSSSADFTVKRGDEELFAGTVTEDPGTRFPVEGTEESCGGPPCFTSSASLDLRGIGQ